MTRKTVPAHVKAAIIFYGEKPAADRPTQKRIAELTGTSERSVYRVLQEAGLLTHMPRMTKEIFQVFQVIKDSGVNTGEIPAALAQFKNGPTRAQILKAITEMEDGTWAALLKDIVTARVAKSHNVGVSTAMLNIMNAVEKNAKSGQ